MMLKYDFSTIVIITVSFLNREPFVTGYLVSSLQVIILGCRKEGCKNNVPLKKRLGFRHQTKRIVSQSGVIASCTLTLGRKRKFIPSPWYKGPGVGAMEPLRSVFNMLQYFEKIFPSVERL